MPLSTKKTRPVQEHHAKISLMVRKFVFLTSYDIMINTQVIGQKPRVNHKTKCQPGNQLSTRKQKVNQETKCQLGNQTQTGNQVSVIRVNQETWCQT